MANQVSNSWGVFVVGGVAIVLALVVVIVVGDVVVVIFVVVDGDVVVVVFYPRNIPLKCQKEKSLILNCCRNDADTVGVKRGCTFTGFTGSNFDGEQIVVTAGIRDRWQATE